MATVIKVDEEEECVPTAMKLLGTRRFIRVDGHSGVGKSRIAKAISKETGWPRICVDEFIDKSDFKKRYEKRVIVEELNERIRSVTEGVILEGLWLDHLVQREQFGPELRIYMRACFAPEFDADEQRRRKKLGTEEYHRLYDPARWADLIVMKVAIF